FDKERYWIEAEANTNAAKGNVLAVLHPLEHSPSSDLSEHQETMTTAVQNQEDGSLVAVPAWEPGDVEAFADATKLQYAQHHVILCDLPQISRKELESLLPGSQCLSLQADEQKHIAQRYCDFALAGFERIQTIFRDKPQGKVLVHIVAAGSGEQALLAGL